MFSSSGQSCPPKLSRLLLWPLATLGVFGFLINTQLSFVTSPADMCYPKTNVVFLKTHKCAGSSIQNLLMRYGDAHNLTFVLPSNGNYLGHPVPFNRAMVAWARLPEYNILAHHTRMNYREIKSLMPRNSVYITILRDPVKVFESSYSYYGLDKFFGRDLEHFTRRLPLISKKFARARSRGKFGTNQMMFDLGANRYTFDNDSLVHSYVNKLDEWFDLVLIADRMDESLVLLRHLLCWDMDDVVTFKLNARSPGFKSDLDEIQREKLRNLNSADVILYNHFLTKFDKSVEEYGRERMAAEIKELETRRANWYQLCVEKEYQVTERQKPKYYYNPKVMVIEPNRNTNNATCISLTMEELPYTDLLRKKQIVKLPKRPQHIIVRGEMHIQKRLPKLQNLTT